MIGTAERIEDIRPERYHVPFLKAWTLQRMLPWRRRGGPVDRFTAQRQRLDKPPASDKY